MNNIKEMLQGWRESRRKKAKAERQHEIRRTFQVTELNGSLYLTCNGIPYKQVERDETSSEIIYRLNDARNALRSYVDGKESEGELVRNLGRGYVLIHAD